MVGRKMLSVTAYVVHRRGWWYNDEFHDAVDPGTPVQTFLSRQKAEAYRLMKERELRLKGPITNPFMLGGLDWSDWSSLEEREFRKRLRKLDLPPVSADLYSWWEEVADDLTDEQKHAVWDLLDHLYLCEVVETEIEVEG
jgi:hypothetical protein